MHGHSEICEALLRAGAQINMQTDPQKYSALHSAAFAGHIATIRLLLANGADRELRNYRGERPVDTAGRQDQVAAVAELEGNGK
jgi:ankyrin repeat protein